MSLLTATLPMEYLEEHGPARVRDLALDMASQLLGERPDAGDVASGKTLPAYRELAQVLEPWLEPLFLPRATVSVEPPRYTSLCFTEDEARRWWRRFLD
ncbi:MAG: type VI immunity family protein [Archangium sp.]